MVGQLTAAVVNRHLAALAWLKLVAVALCVLCVFVVCAQCARVQPCTLVCTQLQPAVQKHISRLPAAASGAHLVCKVVKREAAPQQHALLPVLRKHL